MGSEEETRDRLEVDFSSSQFEGHVGGSPEEQGDEVAKEAAQEEREE